MASEQLVRAAKQLAGALKDLRFSAPVIHVYHPLIYGWAPHAAYLRRYGNGRKQIVFLGMNPGPFGMVQTGIPFGDVAVVRRWLKIEREVEKPAKQHPKRPIMGFECHRGEISGQRLWGLFEALYPRADDFFERHFVVNYCPLAFMEESGRNRTPDKLRREEAAPVYRACDEHLRRVTEILRPRWLVGIGDYARRQAERVLEDTGVRIGAVPHPSPASPSANRGWVKLATDRLLAQGIWK